MLYCYEDNDDYKRGPITKKGHYICPTCGILKDPAVQDQDKSEIKNESERSTTIKRITTISKGKNEGIGPRLTRESVAAQQPMIEIIEENKGLLPTDLRIILFVLCYFEHSC